MGSSVQYRLSNGTTRVSRPTGTWNSPERDKRSETAYTGMTWSGFRPSDDACQYGYLVPANIHAAGGLERILALNQRVWQSDSLHDKATKLLQDIAEGIQRHGIVQLDSGERVYAYEVDGMGHSLTDFDDANVPSLLSLPLLGWSGLDHSIYQATRKRILSSLNPYYYTGSKLQGIGSPHTPHGFVWPMALAMEALTTSSSSSAAKDVVFQIRQSLASACGGAMHESVNAQSGCEGRYTRIWFEWANALFVVLAETALGESCEDRAQDTVRRTNADPDETVYNYYKNDYGNDPNEPLLYQGIEAYIPHAAYNQKPRPQPIKDRARATRLHKRVA